MTEKTVVISAQGFQTRRTDSGVTLVFQLSTESSELVGADFLGLAVSLAEADHLGRSLQRMAASAPGAQPQPSPILKGPETQQ
jgi:hypothetical protein